MFEYLQNGFLGLKDDCLNSFYNSGTQLIISISDINLINLNLFEFRENFFILKINLYREKTVKPLIFHFSNYYYQITNSLIYLYLDITSIEFGFQAEYIEIPFLNNLKNLPNYNICPITIENSFLNPVIFNHCFSNLSNFTFIAKYREYKYSFQIKSINNSLNLTKNIFSKYPSCDNFNFLHFIEHIKCKKLKDIAHYSLVPFAIRIDSYKNTEYYNHREFTNSYFYNYISLLSESCFSLNSFLLHCIIDLFNDLSFKKKLISNDKDVENDGKNPSVNSNFRMLEYLIKKIENHKELLDIQLFFSISEALIRNFFAHGFQTVFMPLFNGRDIYLQYSKEYKYVKESKMYQQLNPYYVCMDIMKDQNVIDFILIYKCESVDTFNNAKTKEYIDDTKNNRVLFNTGTARNFLRYNSYNNTLPYFFEFPTENQLTITLRNKDDSSNYKEFVELNLENTLIKLMSLIQVLDNYCDTQNFI
jgi:hypothetical protein